MRDNIYTAEKRGTLSSQHVVEVVMAVDLVLPVLLVVVVVAVV